MPISLLYHDVVPEGQDDSSGFPGAGAARYKMSIDQFSAHMNAVAGTKKSCGGTVHGLLQSPATPSVLITFDDGGASAYSEIANTLESRGWRGHFFITTDYINSPAFVSAEQIRSLHERGHVIGSHSCSHPERMSYCSGDVLAHEWQQSRMVLSEILGKPVTVASVPGGFYSKAVARAAAAAGIKILFNSEPTTRAYEIDGCLILGRYTLYRGMAAETSAALASGRGVSRWGQTLHWNLKKAAKFAGGRLYANLRKKLLKRAYSPSVNS